MAELNNHKPIANITAPVIVVLFPKKSPKKAPGLLGFGTMYDFHDSTDTLKF